MAGYVLGVSDSRAIGDVVGLAFCNAAMDRQAAVDRPRSASVHLIIADLNMPGMGGRIAPPGRARPAIPMGRSSSSPGLG
jgi:hypothetical protein